MDPKLTNVTEQREVQGNGSSANVNVTINVVVVKNKVCKVHVLVQIVGNCNYTVLYNYTVCSTGLSDSLRNKSAFLWKKCVIEARLKLLASII